MRKLKLKRLSDKATQLVSSRAKIQTQAEYDSRNLTLNNYTSASQNVLDNVDMKGRKMQTVQLSALFKGKAGEKIYIID